MSDLKQKLDDLKTGIQINARMKASKTLIDIYENQAAQLSANAKEQLRQAMVLEDKAHALKRELDHSEKVDVAAIEKEIILLTK
jgi:hypothetical protein